MYFNAPITSPRLETLDVVRVGVSIDVFRQGQVWAQLQEQNASQPNTLHLGSALPMDPWDYPIDATLKDMAWQQRISNATELALRSFPERWRIPAITVVRGYNPNAERLRLFPEEAAKMLNDMASLELGDAGLHWHRITQLKNGVICNDTPEAVIEAVFGVFEQNPDMPALLLYVVEGYNMARILMSHGEKPIGLGTGPRQPGELTDSVVALVVARPERIGWLREFAKYTQSKPDSIDPAFTGWERTPPHAFKPSPFFPTPITQRGFKQWDRLKVLARLHRPVTVSLHQDGKSSIPLKGASRDRALADGWDQAVSALGAAPARAFFDTGKPSGAIAELAPALHAAQHPVDLLDSAQSYDLTQRLGDTGAASPFVGLALATMASYLNADSSVVVPLRRTDRATFIAISPPSPGKQPDDDPFDVALRPQHAPMSEAPSPEFKAWHGQQVNDYQRAQERSAPRYRDPAVVAREQRMLDDFIAGLPGGGPLGPKTN
ncbi:MULTISPECIES: DUF2875 family protein [Achromobacter]|uniref:type VI lipase adapter Tla3 domain-containing protein n=1 Tax=Achromobacter TaxID=222 RepID=UPI0025C16D00|nr:MULTISPECIES: DUF2875 family protein [Achromobacter]